MIRTVIVCAIGCVTLAKVYAQNETLNAGNTLQEFLALAKKGKWEEAKYKNGVSLNYRDLVISDSIETRQLSARFQLKSSNLDSIIAHIKQPKHITLWNDGIKEAKIVKNQETCWVTHISYDIPFPFKQQDLVSYSTLLKKDGTTILFSKSLPKDAPFPKEDTKEGYHLSEWRLTPSLNGSIKVEFCAISLTNSAIPRFLKDPFIQRSLLRSFINLKEGLL